MPEQTAETRAEAVVDALGLLYHDDLDPSEFMLFPTDDAAVLETPTDSTDWHDTYGGRDAFECLVRTILSQHTSDSASQPAHEALMQRFGEGIGEEGIDEDEGEDKEVEDEAGENGRKRVTDLAEVLAAADHGTLAETIRSAGLYNRKAEKIIGAAQRIQNEFGSAAAFDDFVSRESSDIVRDTLLDIDGVGPKTADCVLLFAGGESGVFPVDTHVHRIARRLGIAPPDADHEAVRTVLERDTPAEKCGFGHTTMIQFGREYCSASRPVCLDDPEACPLASLCDQRGISRDSETVVDPAETIG